MCYHKSLAQRQQELLDHYSASFQYITEEHEIIKERFSVLMQKDHQLNSLSLNSPEEIHNILVAYSQKNALPAHYTKEELSQLKWYLKTLSSFRDDGLYRYHENGFDYLPTPIITAGDPTHFKMFNWGLIPYYMNDKQKAMVLRTQTLNCISEEMYEKPSFRDAAKNAQRCLIPVTGFFEWIYVVMELIGDYSENPFEGLSNDIPMLSICRTIEIDLLLLLAFYSILLLSVLLIIFSLTAIHRILAYS